MAFDQSTRNRLQKFVSNSRTLLSEEFTRQMQNDYGLDPSMGTVSPLENLGHLDDTRRETARILRDTLAHYLASSPSGGVRDALERIIREQAFTVLNRLSALRMTESRGILIESVGNGYQSRGFQLYERLAGSGLGETGDTYRCYLFSIFDEFALDLKVLFDRFSPQGRLFPRETALLDLLKLLNDPELAHLWAEDETIGWIYQYFNSKEERKKMRDESAAPRNSRELAVRNQFFTPRYVVEFLTDNTLGRIWYEMTKGETGLKDFCRYLVRRPTEIFLKPGEAAPVQAASDENLSQEELLKQPVHIPHRPLKDPRTIRMLDPACGSMHFGLYSFDLFERIYDEAWELELRLGGAAFVREAGLKPLTKTYPDKEAFLRDVPRLIIEYNIHGIDIDPRAVQIAGLSLWLRAQRSWHNQGVKPTDRPHITRSNIVCAEPMPGEEEMRREFTAGLKPRVLGQIVDEVFEKMKLAGEAGSLLKIEEEIKDAVAKAKGQWEEQPKSVQLDLFGGSIPLKPVQMELRFDVKGITDERFWDKAEDRILDTLKSYSEQAENGRAVSRRLFSDDAARGFAFIDLCRKCYDLVLMNPPFGDATFGSRSYLSYMYPEAKHDLAAAFVDRAYSLIGLWGDVGCISTRTLFFLPTSEKWRKKVFPLGRMCVFADLGLEIMDGATVYAAAYTFSKGRAGESIFFRGTDWQDKEDHLYLEAERLHFGAIGTETYIRNISRYIHLPGWVLPYYLPQRLSNVFSQFESLGKLQPGAKQGIATSDDFRFVRAQWEVPRDYFEHGWVLHTKGGEFSPFYVDVDFVLNWASKGIEVKAFAEKLTEKRFGSPSWSRWINAVDYYFRIGLTFTYRSRRFGVGVMPPGVVFGVTGMSVFIDGNIDDHLEAMAIMNSSPFNFLLFMLCERRDPLFQAGKINSVPWPLRDSSGELRRLALAAYYDSEHYHSLAENSPIFNGPFHENILIKSNINDLAIDEKKWALNLVDRWIDRQNKIDHIVAELYGIDEPSFTALRSELAVFLGDGNHDCLGSPTARIKDELLISIMSYLLGCCFGRWDIRFAVDPSLAPKLPDPYDPLPVCPPGILIGPEGLPAEANRIVSEEWLRTRPSANTLPPPGVTKNPIIPDSEYPLHINWSGILVDDEGHPVDIVSRIREVIEVIWKEKAGDIEHEACEILGVRSLRDYFAKPSGFFADHLKRYSKSRRQAPIYWPISTPSGAYTLWIYYHRLNDQTLYTCVMDYLEPKLRDVAGELTNLRQKGSGRNRDDEKKLEKLQEFELDLQKFRDELLRLARLPWKPNLNDGVQITAAPLWKLFQLPKWKKTLKETWGKLEKGDYDWAHLAYSIWPDRVREKCKKDKSLAIAHNLEELYEEPPASAKKKRSKKAVVV